MNYRTEAQTIHPDETALPFVLNFPIVAFVTPVIQTISPFRVLTGGQSDRDENLTL